MPAQAVDARVEDHGSIFLVTPMTEKARVWISENTSEEAFYWGGSLVVEHRYVENLANGMIEAGLNVA